MATEEREEQQEHERKAEGRDVARRGDGDGGQERPPLRPIALRGAAGGAAAGAVVGAAVAVARALRPEQAEAAQQRLLEAGREISTAAVRAAGGVLTAKPVADLISGNKGDGERSETVKQAAKEAGVAAATAARRALVSMRDEPERNGK